MHHKSDSLVRIYTELFAGMRPDISILEIGLAEGGSLALWRELMPSAQIYGVDTSKQFLLKARKACPSAALFEADQNHFPSLQNAAQFMGGLDIVIDDGWHTGLTTYNTGAAFSPLLMSGGLYCIEDWGTGYWPTWHDGHAYSEMLGPTCANQFSSHNWGMVGFIKQLVDQVGKPDAMGKPTELESIEIRHGLAILRKR